MAGQFSTTGANSALDTSRDPADGDSIEFAAGALTLTCD